MFNKITQIEAYIRYRKQISNNRHTQKSKNIEKKRREERRLIVSVEATKANVEAHKSMKQWNRHKDVNVNNR